MINLGGSMSDFLFDEEESSVLDKVLRLQDGLITRSTGGIFNGDYSRLRVELLKNSDIKDKLPPFIKRYRDTDQFWQFIKYEFTNYADRRKFIWDSFFPLIEYLETNDRTPTVAVVTDSLKSFSYESIYDIWQKALDRRNDDPEGAITAARTLLETTCKHILDDMDVTYKEDADLPKLYAACAEVLKLAPNQYEEELFKSVLGNCQSIVNNIGAIRNRIGDAHGKGRKALKPKPKHAELVVNLAGTMASFLVNTFNEQRGNS